ncbi:MAG TPA: FAD-dependent thymidylate synthase [Maribacter sp.]|nr:FAD-dependent thymidylate synthase [Maribacter sp.]
MKVTLLNCTPNAEDHIVEVARVSSSRKDKKSKPEGLLNYLIKHKHWSPFEMVHIVMEINTTRDIGRQILRHRSFSFQEFSQRYADPTKELDFKIRDARLQDKKNRQNSIEMDETNTDHRHLQYIFEQKQKQIKNLAIDSYQHLLENGVAKEQARSVLPEGLVMSKMYMSGTLRSWIHYCELRMANGTQKEHMEIAKKCWSIIQKDFPNVVIGLHKQES